MKGNEQVIEALNAGLTIELTAINTYFIHSKMLRNWGLNKLADYYYAESMEEMNHADEVFEDAFCVFDLPSKGKLPTGKLLGALAVLGESVTKPEAAELAKGGRSRDEFVRVMQGRAPPPKPVAAAKPAARRWGRR